MKLGGIWLKAAGRLSLPPADAANAEIFTDERLTPMANFSSYTFTLFEI